MEAMEDKPMKRTAKPVFFIVALLIFALTYTSFFGVYTYYGDRRDTIIRGAADIRFGIDIRGGVDVTFAPEDENIEVTADQINDVRNVIAQRLIRNNITDYEAYSDVTNKQVIVRFPLEKRRIQFRRLAGHRGTGENRLSRILSRPAGKQLRPSHRKAGCGGSCPDGKRRRTGFRCL